jgi:16S rRNA (guanine(1405)-N(7))-methyltransferase
MAEQTSAAIIEEVVRAVLASAKYAALDPALVAEVAAQELGKGRRRKDAVKEVKNRLHQSVGAYWDSHADYASWRAALEAAADDAAQEAVLRSIMHSHHSTRERLPFLADFYRTLFNGIGPVHSVLDLGCGLNPLALPWMKLPADALYLACDVDREQISFLDWWLAHNRRRGCAFVWNLLDSAPEIDVANFDAETQNGRDAQRKSLSASLRPSEPLCESLRLCVSASDSFPVDVALLLKLAPCLEQLEKGVVRRLFDELTAQVLIVSFPVQSLGGQRKGMVENYSAQMGALLTGRNWAVECFEFASELVFRIRRDAV